MSLLHKPIDQIIEDDLQLLISTPVYESRILDYKEQLPGESSSKKKEFLYDIASFANSGGGELIYGISEERVEGKTTGKPYELLGVDISNKDELIRKYENLIRTSMQPRIYGLQMEAIALTNGNHVLIIRIPNSMNSPHMVTLEGEQKFYTRNSAGKHPMDISEIRSSILASSDLSKQIKNLRLDRASSIKSNNSLLTLEPIPHYLLVHLIPFSSFSHEQVSPASQKMQATKMKPFFTTGWDYKYNFDGFVTFAKWPHANYPHAYVQFFRNGVIESVDNGLLAGKDIPSQKIEVDIIENTYNYLEAQKAVGILPPIVLSITLLGVKDFNFPVSRWYANPDSGGKIEQDDLFIPEVILETYPSSKDELSKVLQNSFDTVWNAAGWPKSLNYNDNGDWVGQRDY